jgi:hypothetical protein
MLKMSERMLQELQNKVADKLRGKKAAISIDIGTIHRKSFLAVVARGESLLIGRMD